VLADALAAGETDAWVLRACIVAGPDAVTFVEQARWPDRLPGPLGTLAGAVAVLPDAGVPFQLVHHDDVATALRAGVLGRGAPGAYNLAADGEVTMRDLADALGYHTIPMPRLAVEAASEVVARLPFLPEERRGTAPPRADGHEQGAAPAEVAPALRRQADPGAHRQRATAVIRRARGRRALTPAATTRTARERARPAARA
jgi:hypothetical protein